MTDINLLVIEEKIGYKFKQKDLLLQAFVRTSFKYEHEGYEDNEKLEFIGDKVLDCVVVKKLTKIFGYSCIKEVQSLDSIKSNEKESRENQVELETFEFVNDQGKLTEIKKMVVQTKFLAKAIERLGLERYLILGKGDLVNNVIEQPHVKEDLCEAIIGAVTLDCEWNFDVIEEVIDRMLNLDYFIKFGVEDDVDYISFVQAWHQKEYGKNPDYFFLKGQSGNLFACALILEGYDNAVFEGVGYSKKSAIYMSAKSAYEYIKKRDNAGKKFLDAIKDYDLESAINKIQELSDKKLIQGLVFIENELAPNAESNGNPIWSCECKVDGITTQVIYSDAKKKLAKKKAAYQMLQILTGIRASEEIIELNSHLPL